MYSILYFVLSLFAVYPASTPYPSVTALEGIWEIFTKIDFNLSKVPDRLPEKEPFYLGKVRFYSTEEGIGPNLTRTVDLDVVTPKYKKYRGHCEITWGSSDGPPLPFV